jgi:hypothetical protein
MCVSLEIRDREGEREGGKKGEEEEGVQGTRA